MSDSQNELRLCPTRIDAAPVLFAHKVSDGQCQDRQRGHYHKCFTCAWNNLYVGIHGHPAAAEGTREVKKVVRAG
jgi:hypothetical protein